MIPSTICVNGSSSSKSSSNQPISLLWYTEFCKASSFVFNSIGIWMLCELLLPFHESWFYFWAVTEWPHLRNVFFLPFFFYFFKFMKNYGKMHNYFSFFFFFFLIFSYSHFSGVELLFYRVLIIIYVVFLRYKVLKANLNIFINPL